MKFQLASDVHLEFGAHTIKNAGADVLILSGDICVVNDLNKFDSFGLVGENNRSQRFHDFFQSCCSVFPHVIYVMGNHEHYHGDFALSASRIRENLGYLHNLHFLEKEFVELNGVCIAGATLWTNMNKNDPITLSHIKGYMNDYRIIDNSNEVVNFKAYVEKEVPAGVKYEDWLALDHAERFDTVFKQRPAKFTPEVSVIEHKQTLEAFKQFIESRPEMPWVIVGHHAPSKLSTKPQYERDYLVNGAYSSDLSNFILDHPQIKLWTHGHTHHAFDYMIGSTRIACNPRGYDGYEDDTGYEPEKIFEIDC